MKLNPRKREQMLALCRELHDDDGVDPRIYFRTARKRNKENRKDQQLCRQVAETLGLVLAGEFDDPRLHNLQVVSVRPAPDASQLLVTLRSDLPPGSAVTEEILGSLDSASGHLRCAVATAITRKRTPRLSFQIVDSDNSGEVEP